jgi:hypothetical protein
MACLGVVMRWAVLAVATLVVTPGAYAQQNPALAGVTMIDLDGRAVRVQAMEMSDRIGSKVKLRSVGYCQEWPMMQPIW